MSEDWRVTLYLPGLLEKAIRVRAEEFDYPSLSPFITELVCFDLRARVPHIITLPISQESSAVRDAIDREIIRNYVPKAPRNEALMARLMQQLAEAGHFGEWQKPEDIDIPFERPPENPKTKPDHGPASKFSCKVRLPLRLQSIIELRWPEVGYPNPSEYVTGLIRYDLMLGGPHTYFNGHDRARYLLDSLDIETELTFNARRERRRILLDYMIEKVAGRPLSDEERHDVMTRLSQRLRDVALEGQRARSVGSRIAKPVQG